MNVKLEWTELSICVKKAKFLGNATAHLGGRSWKKTMLNLLSDKFESEVLRSRH